MTELDPRRLDRNWTELLQELRVVQTGVQILTAFLLTVPFAPGFERLGDTERHVFAAVLVDALLSTLLLTTPVALHRQLFRRGERPWLVAAAHRSTQVGLVLLVLANVGAAWIVLGLLVPGWIATTASVLLGVVAIGLWVVLPARVRRSG